MNIKIEGSIWRDLTKVISILYYRTPRQTCLGREFRSISMLLVRIRIPSTVRIWIRIKESQINAVPCGSRSTKMGPREGTVSGSLTSNALAKKVANIKIAAKSPHLQDSEFPLLTFSWKYKCFRQCCGSMPFWCGSGSGSADPCLWQMDPDSDPDPDLDPDPGSGSCYFFVIDIQDANKKLIFLKSSAHYFLKVHLHYSSKKKSQK